MFKFILAILKQATKYGVKNVLRQFGIFGLSGSIKQLIRSDKKMTQIMKLFSKNALKSLGKVNFILDWQKEGFAYALKRVSVSMTPMEVKKLYYFFNTSVSKGMDKVRLTQDKKKLWDKVQNMSKEQKSVVLDKLIRTTPDTEGDRRAKHDLLNYTFWFTVASPESGNFSVLPQYANISQRTYGVPIRGVIGPMIKYYSFDDLGIHHWRIVKMAMETGDYGRNVYSIIRSEVPASRKILIKELYYNNI